MTDWISVKDRMPKSAYTVLVCNAAKRGGRVWLSGTDKTGNFPVNYITHWMPLPEPPKEEIC